MAAVVAEVQESFVGKKVWHMNISFLEAQGGQIPLVVPLDGKKDGPHGLHLESVVPHPSIEPHKIKDGSLVSSDFLGTVKRWEHTPKPSSHMVLWLQCDLVVI